MPKPLLLVLVVKLPRLKGVGVGKKTEACVNWDGPIAMVRCLHQGNIYIKRKLWVWRDQKCIFLLRAENPFTCAGCQTTQFERSRYRAENANLRKLGWTYRHFTVFAPRQYLYQHEDKGMERPEMYSPSQCKNPSYLCGPSNYPVSRESV